jgi:beta-galactosidase beta subunit
MSLNHIANCLYLLQELRQLIDAALVGRLQRKQNTKYVIIGD